MVEASTPDLVALLRGPTLRNRTGLLTLPIAWLGREREVATRLGIGYEDHRARVLGRLQPEQLYLGMDWASLVRSDLDAIVHQTRSNGGCTLVANVDLVLSSFGSDDRRRFWESLREMYRPASGLLLTLPEASHRLMAGDEHDRWKRANRLAKWTE